jgi:hypothetical protein
VLIHIRQFFWSWPYVNGIGARAAFVSLRPSDETPSCGCHTVRRLVAGTRGGRLGSRHHVGGQATPSRARRPLRKGGPIPYPPVPTSPELIIAAIRLQVSQHTALTQADIFLVG